MTDISSSVLRDGLSAALVARGIPNGAQIAASLGDLEGCMATVAWWDDRRGTKTPGLLVHMLRTGQARDYRGRSATRTLTAERDRVRAMEEQMREMGFSEREVPFAASARLTRGETTAERLRAHLRFTMPTLYEPQSCSPIQHRR